MHRLSILFCWPFGLLLAGSTGLAQQPTPLVRQRQLLYAGPARLDSKLKEAVESIRNLGLARVPYEKLSPTTDYFVRIAPRRVIVDDKNRIKPEAVLGTKPFVFLTSPQGV